MGPPIRLEETVRGSGAAQSISFVEDWRRSSDVAASLAANGGQKRYFKAYCQTRGPPPRPTLPTALRSPAVGALNGCISRWMMKLVRFATLNASRRTCNRWPSFKTKFLVRPPLIDTRPGPSRMLRPELPNANGVKPSSCTPQLKTSLSSSTQDGTALKALRSYQGKSVPFLPDPLCAETLPFARRLGRRDSPRLIAGLAVVTVSEAPV